jgi:hypothetical protein
MNAYESPKSCTRLKIINSRNYKRFKPLLIIAFLATYFLSFVFTFPWQVVVALIVLNLLLIVLMSGLSKNFDVKGFLSLDHKNIVLEELNVNPVIVPISGLTDFKIIRNATVHYADTDMYPPETHNNWISFSFNNRPYKFEFCIMDKEENEKFESIINLLRREYPDFHYASI